MSTLANQQLRRLTPEEKLKLMQEGKYFRYRELGYLGKDCPKYNSTPTTAPIQKPVGPQKEQSDSFERHKEESENE